MSLRENYKVELSEIQKNKVIFKLENSDLKINIYALKDNLIRVYFDKGINKKTWMLSPNNVEMPNEGLNPEDLSFGDLPKIDVIDEEGKATISTSKLKVEINKEDFHLTWHYLKDNEWKLLLKDRYTQCYNFEGELGSKAKHYLTRYPEEKYYGLGEKTGELERSNRRFKMIGVDPMGYDPIHTDPLYKIVPFYITKKEDYNAGLFYDCISHSEFDMGKEYDNYHGKFRYFESLETNLDYYVFANDTIADTVVQFTEMTGRPLFMPKWSISYSGSTMTYTDAPDAQEQLNKFIEKCKEYDVPCTSFQMSSGYTSIGDKRHVFNWNYDKFPDVKKFTKHYLDNGVNLCANIKPALLLSNPKYKEVAEKELFIKDAEGNPELVMFWDELGAYLDFTNSDTIEWWKEQVKENLLDYNINSTWNDNNEYEIWSETAVCHGFGENLNFENTRAIQPLLMMKASYDIQREVYPNERPYLISRSGCTGMQRYAQTWSGDNRSDWETLKYNIKTGLGMSISGVHNIGHDVGGFAGDAPSEELFIRWVQNGIFHPRFTIHSWNDDKTVNTPWLYENSAATIVELLKFRETIKPHLYNLMYLSHSEYKPMITPTLYKFENDIKTFEENDDFMLGDEILVCSVVEKGEKTRKVYLPENQTGWIEYKTKTYYKAGQEVEIEFDLDDINFFVQAGSVLYLNKANHGFNTNLENRTLSIFPKENGSTEFKFFEDDGQTVLENNEYSFVQGTVTFDSDKIEVNVEIEGNYKIPFTGINVDINNDKRKLIVNGQEMKKEQNEIII